MKQYIGQKYYNRIYSTKKSKYYFINNKYHGLFIFYAFPKNEIPHKGYFNMDMEYSHWKEYDKFLRYYL